ncbi:MAG: hypothetical protein AAB610_03145 [Patescibacteria group bacterium]
MKKNKVKDNFLAELRKIPIVQVACERIGVSRNSVYRWKNTDEIFSDEMDRALAEGEALVNDLTENQLLTLIKEKEWSAISFWLRHRNPKFRERVEITTKTESDGKLTAEQESIVREALRLSAVAPVQTITDNKQDDEPK